jgi:hypothetical protein
MTDRVATTGTVWLGMTIGCAQCHTHKYDPIPHREYYRFMAFLNNADEPPLTLKEHEIQDRRHAIEAKIEQKIADLAKRFPAPAVAGDTRSEDERRQDVLASKFQDWLNKESARTVRWQTLKPVEASSNSPILTILPDGSVVSTGDQTKSDTYTVKYRDDLKGVTAIRLDVLPDDRLPGRGPGRVYYEGSLGDFFLCEFTVTLNGKPVTFKKSSESFSKGKGFEAALAVDGNPLTGWTTDGGQGRAHSAVFIPTTPLDDSGELAIQMLFERYYSSDLGKFRISVTTDPREAIARELPDDIEKLLLAPDAQRSDEQKARLFREFLLVAPELAKEREAIEAMRKEMPEAPSTLIMAERPTGNTRPTFRHNRGEFLQTAERVEPGVLSILHALPKDAKPDRLTFARWLVSPENPLVGRVTVNRQWAALFGRGIVPTLQDFGYQGDPPSHPELLDWLAVEFVKQGWSLKKMHKLIVMSATYQQASQVTPEHLEKDGRNVLLSRSPRVRLDAEVIRDQALRVSGLLSEKVGGPSVFPPQPAGVTTEGTYGGLFWKVSKGPDRYRRGLYTYMKRTTPYAMFMTFDGPSGEVCVARRDVSNTPLQALTLLNDTVFTEPAQALGQTLAKEPGTVEERVESLFRRCLARAPESDERADLVRYYESQKPRFVNRELNAEKIAGPGEGDVNERAVWTVLARAVLNLDEFITKE